MMMRMIWKMQKKKKRKNLVRNLLWLSHNRHSKRVLSQLFNNKLKNRLNLLLRKLRLKRKKRVMRRSMTQMMLMTC